MKEARKWLEAEVPKGIKDGSIDKTKLGRVEVVLADFFDDEWLKMVDVPLQGGFELVYDYAVRSRVVTTANSVTFANTYPTVFGSDESVDATKMGSSYG